MATLNIIKLYSDKRDLITGSSNFIIEQLITRDDNLKLEVFEFMKFQKEVKMNESVIEKVKPVLNRISSNSVNSSLSGFVHSVNKRNKIPEETQENKSPAKLTDNLKLFSSDHTYF